MRMLLEDPDLRSTFARDPDEAVIQSGLNVDEEDVSILEELDWEGEELPQPQKACECAICE